MTPINGMMMRKVLVLLSLVIGVHMQCAAFDHAESLQSLAKMAPESITQTKVIAMFGQPERVEQLRKGVKWYYTNGGTELTINWSARSGSMQKFAFSHQPAAKTIFDNNIERQLKSGQIDITTAMKLLGVPKDMVMKEATQVMHYSYQNSMLRLFFRDRKLVDYTLVENGARL